MGTPLIFIQYKFIIQHTRKKKEKKRRKNPREVGATGLTSHARHRPSGKLASRPFKLFLDHSNSLSLWKFRKISQSWRQGTAFKHREIRGYVLNWTKNLVISGRGCAGRQRNAERLFCLLKLSRFWPSVGLAWVRKQAKCPVECESGETARRWWQEQQETVFIFLAVWRLARALDISLFASRPSPPSAPKKKKKAGPCYSGYSFAGDYGN